MKDSKEHGKFPGPLARVPPIRQIKENGHAHGRQPAMTTANGRLECPKLLVV